MSGSVSQCNLERDLHIYLSVSFKKEYFRNARGSIILKLSGSPWRINIFDIYILFGLLHEAICNFNFGAQVHMCNNI